MSLGGTAVDPENRDHSQTAKSNRTQVSQTWMVRELSPLNRALKLKCRKLKILTDVLLEGEGTSLWLFQNLNVQMFLEV